MNYYTIQSGRPSNITGRPQKELKVYDVLENLGIEFCRVEHEALDTMEACVMVDTVLKVNMCKNLFLCNSQKNKFYLLLIRGEKKFVTKDLSKQIGSARLSFASKEDMEKYLGITPGSVTAMGLINDKDGVVQLLIDNDLMKEEFIACHPCINTSSIKIKMEDLLNKFLPFTRHEPTVVYL
jgi:Ala-tRNA(Pro) deacylase